MCSPILQPYVLAYTNNDKKEEREGGGDPTIEYDNMEEKEKEILFVPKDLIIPILLRLPVCLSHCVH